MDKQKEIDDIKRDLKAFSTCRPLFDKCHYRNIKVKTPSITAAETLYQHQRLKEQQLDDLEDDLDDIKLSLESIVLK